MINLPKDTLRVSKADAHKDRDEILRLWRLGFPSINQFEEKYDWFYGSNPAGIPFLYLLKSGEANVGIEGIGPKDWLLNGENIKSGLFADLVVDPAFRSLGPALTLIKESTRQSISDMPVLYGFPNPKSLPVYKRGGFELLGMMNRYALPLQSAPYIERYSKLAARLFGGGIDYIYKLAEKAVNRKLRKSLKGTVCSHIEQDFDMLWSHRKPDDCSMAKRDKAFLLWRFENNPMGDYKLYILNSRSTGTLLGYIYYEIDALFNVNIIDFLASDNDHCLFGLFKLFCQDMRAAGYKSVSVEFFGMECVVNALRGSGFKFRDAQPIIYAANPDRQISSSAENWYITSADRD